MRARPNKQAIHKFLEELTQLSLKHGLQLVSCGCCEGIFTDLIGDEDLPGKYYTSLPNSSGIQWRNNAQAEEEQKQQEVTDKYLKAQEEKRKLHQLGEDAQSKEELRKISERRLEIYGTPTEKPGVFKIKK
jgi:hypothetical protein